VIALDSSVLVGVIRGEREVQQLPPLLEGDECAIGAPTAVETLLWCSANLTTHAADWLEDFIDVGPAIIVTSAARWPMWPQKHSLNSAGRAGTGARLNFGDCLTYAVAAVMRAPQGRRFQTDGCDGASDRDPGLINVITLSALLGSAYPVFRRKSSDNSQTSY
jgi:ribonuclease VapC